EPPPLSPLRADGVAGVVGGRGAPVVARRSRARRRRVGRAARGHRHRAAAGRVRARARRLLRAPRELLRRARRALLSRRRRGAVRGAGLAHVSRGRLSLMTFAGAPLSLVGPALAAGAAALVALYLLK